MTTLVEQQQQRVTSAARRSRLLVEDDAEGWRCDASEAREAARLRHAFRDYLLAYGHPASDVEAAETVYGELCANCVRHAPGRVRVEFRWYDSTLSVTDESDRLRCWPFSPGDCSSEATHHGYSIVSSHTARVQLSRPAAGGTCVTVVLPVLRAV